MKSLTGYEAFVGPVSSGLGGGRQTPLPPSQAVPKSNGVVLVRETCHGSAFRFVRNAESQSESRLDTERWSESSSGGMNRYPGLGKMERTLLWFRNDLRLADNPCVEHVLKESTTLLPVVCLDPSRFRGNDDNVSRTSAELVHFLVDSVKALKKQLKSRGSDLLVMVGSPEVILPSVCSEYSRSSVVFQRGFSRRDIIEEEKVIQSLREKTSISVRMLFSNTLFDLDKLPFDVEKAPPLLSDFRDTLERVGSLKEGADGPVHMPRLPTRRCKGGEEEGMRVLNALAAGVQSHVVLEDQLESSTIPHFGQEIVRDLYPWLLFGCLSTTRLYSTLVHLHPQTEGGPVYYELVYRDFHNLTNLGRLARERKSANQLSTTKHTKLVESSAAR